MAKEDNLLDNIVFLVISLVFFSILVLYVINISSGAFVLEQTYAKQLALFLDNSKPNTIISIEFTKAFELAKENNIAPEDIVKINNNYVIVQLTNSESYSYPYFSRLEVVNINYNEENDKTYLNLNIGSKDE